MTNASRREIRDPRTAPAAGGSLVYSRLTRAALRHACFTLALILFAPGVSAEKTGTETWTTTLPSMETGSRANIAAVAYGSDIFVMGGKTVGSVPTYYNDDATFLLKYSGSDSQWTNITTEIPSSLLGVVAGAAGVIGSSIYYVGGDNDDTSYATMFEYDIATETWSDMPSMPTSRSYLGLAVSSDTLYAVGGMTDSSGTPLSTFEAYTVSTESTSTWATLSSMPSALIAPAAVEHSGVVYVLGGNDGSAALSSVFAYTTATNKWETLTDSPMTVSRYALAAGVVGQYLYAVGGIIDSGTTATDAIEQFDLATQEWETMTNSMPTARAYCGLGVYGQDLYVVGGVADSTYYSLLESFNAPIPDPTPFPTLMPTDDLAASVSSALAAATASTAIFVGALAITASAALLRI